MKFLVWFIVGCLTLLTGCGQPQCDDLQWAADQWWENTYRMRAWQKEFEEGPQDSTAYALFKAKVELHEAEQHVLLPYWQAYNDGTCLPRSPER
jgi:hypothetical protein